MPVSATAGRVVSASLSALLLSPRDKLGFAVNILLALLHGAGTAALATYYHSPPLLTVGFLILIVSFQFATSSAILSPFFFAYAVLLMRVIFVRILHGSVGGYFDYELPDWRLALLQVDAATLASGIYSALIAITWLLRSRVLAMRLASLGLTASTIIWAAVEYIAHRTSGTTGSDPYTYVQTALDIAGRGTPAHRFSLFPAFDTVKIGWFELLHVGYHLPMNQLGDAVSVLPIGGSFAYAVAFRLFGEDAIYWVNPVFTLLAVIASGLLAWELSRGHSSVLRLTVAAATAAIVATANQQVDWAGVTMVDSQAELFSVLSLFFALRGRHAKWTTSIVLSGAFLAAAYWVRHTQLVLVPSVVLILLVFNHATRDRIKALLLCGGTAMLLAFVDLWYHQAYLGGWLHPESEELALFSATAIWSSASSLFLQAFAANEFGWLAPFVICGTFLFLVRDRNLALALLIWLVVSLAFHLPYAAVRLRDLLPEFPAVAFLAAFGVCGTADALLANRRFRWATGILVLAGIQLTLLRVWNTVPRVWEPAQPIFGYMSASQRESFARLGAVTPPDAVIGSTLNDGAIEMYSGRSTFRPDGWNSAERRVFLDVVRQLGAPVYVLQDGTAMDGVLDDIGRDMQLRRIATLDVPLFGDGKTKMPGALWMIEQK